MTVKSLFLCSFPRIQLSPFFTYYKVLISLVPHNITVHHFKYIFIILFSRRRQKLCSCILHNTCTIHPTEFLKRADITLGNIGKTDFIISNYSTFLKIKFNILSSFIYFQFSTVGFHFFYLVSTFATLIIVLF